MNTPKAASLQLGLAMAGIIILTSWGALGGAAFALRASPRAVLPHTLQLPPARAGDSAGQAARAKLEASLRLGELLSHPDRLEARDLPAMRRAFGPRAPALLGALRRADSGR